MCHERVLGVHLGILVMSERILIHRGFELDDEFCKGRIEALLRTAVMVVYGTVRFT
jgi:hypothetical protein